MVGTTSSVRRMCVADSAVASNCSHSVMAFISPCSSNKYDPLSQCTYKSVTTQCRAFVIVQLVMIGVEVYVYSLVDVLVVASVAAKCMTKTRVK